MNHTDIRDVDLVSKLRRLDAGARGAAPAFDYQGMLARHEAGQVRARRRHALARGSATAMVVALVAVSVWRLGPGPRDSAPAIDVAASELAPQPSLVRADTWMALTALEEHIASIDDALNHARVMAPSGAEVARLERTRAELLDSYAQVRYADRVSANF